MIYLGAVSVLLLVHGIAVVVGLEYIHPRQRDSILSLLWLKRKEDDTSTETCGNKERDTRPKAGTNTDI